MKPDDPSTTGPPAALPLLDITVENSLHDMDGTDVQPSCRNPHAGQLHSQHGVFLRHAESITGTVKVALAVRRIAASLIPWRL